jgi:hypothetical protein
LRLRAGPEPETNSASLTIKQHQNRNEVNLPYVGVQWGESRDDEIAKPGLSSIDIVCEPGLPIVDDDEEDEPSGLRCNMVASFSGLRGPEPECPFIMPWAARNFLILSRKATTLWFSRNQSGRFAPNPRH